MDVLTVLTNSYFHNSNWIPNKKKKSKDFKSNAVNVNSLNNESNINMDSIRMDEITGRSTPLLDTFTDELDISGVDVLQNSAVEKSTPSFGNMPDFPRPTTTVYTNNQAITVKKMKFLLK